MCVPQGFPGSCPQGGGGHAGESAIRPDSDVASRGGAATSGSGGASAGKNSGGSGDAGQGGDGGGPVADLAISAPEDRSICDGRQERIPLEATGGIPPYRWNLRESDCGLSLQTAVGPTTELVGVPARTGACQFVVTVSDHAVGLAQATVAVEVHETPRLSTASLGTACVSEEYRAGLAAEGGDEANYVFNAQTDATGDWSTADGHLSGTVRSVEPIDFEVWVDDGRCESARETLTLEVEAETSKSCPHFTVDPRGEPLPEPCSGQAYDVVLTATPQFHTWEAVDLPPGLELEQAPNDPSSGLLSGVAAWPAGEARPITLRLIAQDGRSFINTHSLTPRDKCWLGYISRQDGSWQFHLFDRVLQKRHSFPAQGGPPVTSFRFSPDGEFVAYEARAEGAPAALTLLSTRSLRQQPLEFPGSVAQYAWSRSASFLAVAFEPQAGQTLLGGLGVSSKSVASSPTYLQPVAAAVASELTWFGENGVAYQVVPSIPQLRWVEHTRLGPSGFTQPTPFPENYYVPPAQVMGFPQGYVVTDAGNLSFFPTQPINGFTRFAHANPANVLAPNGRYFARVVAGELQVFRTDVLEPQQPVASQHGCGALLAWAQSGDRIACVTNLEGGGELRIFSLHAGEPQLSVTSVSNEYVYSQNGSSERRRAFSPSGRYFAFATDAALYVNDNEDPRNFRTYAPWGSGTPQLEAPFVDLAFSRDERFLLQHRGQELTLHDLGEQGSRIRLTQLDPMHPPPSCSERYMEFSEKWCGGSRLPKDFQWSNNDRLAAFVTESRQLQTLRISSTLEISTEPVIDDCGPGCVQSFELQP